MANKYDQLLRDMMEHIYGEGAEPRSDVDVLNMIKNMESGVARDHALNADISNEELDALIEEEKKHKHLTVEDATLQAKVNHLLKGGLSLDKIARHLFDEYEIMTTASHIREILFFSLQELKDFRARQLKACYPIVYIDTLYVKMLTTLNLVVEHPFFIIVGMDTNGQHELLSVNAYHRNYKDESVEQSMWVDALKDLLNRGFIDPVYIVTGPVRAFKEALRLVYPRAIYQHSLLDILHQAQEPLNTAKRAQFTNDFRSLYNSRSLLECMKALGVLEDKWRAEHHNVIKFIKDRFIFFEQYFAANASLRTSIRATKPVTMIINEVRRDIKNDTSYSYRDCLQTLLRILEVRKYMVKDIKPVQWKRALKSILDDPYTGKILSSYIDPKDIQLSRRSIALQKSKQRKAEDNHKSSLTRTKSFRSI